MKPSRSSRPLAAQERPASTYTVHEFLQFKEMTAKIIKLEKAKLVMMMLNSQFSSRVVAKFPVYCEEVLRVSKDPATLEDVSLAKEMFARGQLYKQKANETTQTPTSTTAHVHSSSSYSRKANTQRSQPSSTGQTVENSWLKATIKNAHLNHQTNNNNGRAHGDGGAWKPADINKPFEGATIEGGSINSQSNNGNVGYTPAGGYFGQGYGAPNWPEPGFPPQWGYPAPAVTDSSQPFLRNASGSGGRSSGRAAIARLRGY